MARSRFMRECRSSKVCLHSPEYLDFVTMSFDIVLVRFAVFLVPGGLVRTVTERLVLGKSAHANPDRLLLRFDFQRSFV